MSVCVCASLEIERGWHEPCSTPYLVSVERVYKHDRCVELFNYYCQITNENHNRPAKKECSIFQIKLHKMIEKWTKAPAIGMRTKRKVKWIWQKQRIKSRSHFERWLFAGLFFTLLRSSHIDSHLLWSSPFRFNDSEFIISFFFITI